MYTCHVHMIIHKVGNASHTLVSQVVDMNALEVDTATKGTQWGTGGMVTKLTAARIATAAGCSMAICNAKDPRNILRVLGGERRGTVFRALPTVLRCVCGTVSVSVHLIKHSVCCSRRPMVSHVSRVQGSQAVDPVHAAQGVAVAGCRCSGSCA